MLQEPHTASKIVEACICLHNLMRMWNPAVPAEVDHDDENHHVIPGCWRNGVQMEDVDNPQGGNRATKAAKAQRAYFKHCYNSPQGRVPWQDRMV